MKNFIIVMVLFLTSSFSWAVIPNEQQISETIKRGGRPEMSDILSLRQQGYKTIINLENDRGPVEREKQYAESLGFQYISNPMSAFEKPDDAAIDALLEVMQNPENQPIFIHCLHGRDRTGLVSGLYRVFVDNWTADAAYDEMLNLGFRPFFYNLKDYFKQKTRGHFVVENITF